jgi:hypothetical protein
MMPMSRSGITKEERLQGPGRIEEILYEAHLQPLKKVLP